MTIPTKRPDVAGDDIQSDEDAKRRFQRALDHWTPANEARALAVIMRMYGVDDAVFYMPTQGSDPRVASVRTGNGRSDYGRSGTLTYKGHEFRFYVLERLGTQSGTGYITVLDDDGHELGKATYSIPKTDGGFARPDTSRLGDSIEEGLLARRLSKPLAQMFGGVDTPMLHVYGGKVSLGIRDFQYGGAGLTYHGGRKWSGYGGPAYGDQATQRRAAVRALGEGNEARGKKRLVELNALLTEVQAAHDAEFPPTAGQMKLRRR